MEEFDEPPVRHKCTRIILFIWKVFTCLFTHVMLITMVVSYCLLGAKTFEYLESTNEKLVKSRIHTKRYNATDFLWAMTNEINVLYKTNWTKDAMEIIKRFEEDLVYEIKKNGWDGSEDTGSESLQWTFTGALFYSIIVITTIGYGHIAPKTDLGKIVTVFYAIVGIPLMLLCLSNIGDIMAHSFRFLYWKICCYACTRPRRKSLRRQGSRNSRLRNGGRSRTASFTYGQANQPVAELASIPSQGAITSFSEDERRIGASSGRRFNRESSVPAVISHEAVPVSTAAPEHLSTPVLCNKYAIDAPAAHREPRYAESHQSPGIMSPMGFMVGRQSCPPPSRYSYYSYSDNGDDYNSNNSKPVPIWLCVLLVVSYILGGAYLFSQWEGWDFGDSAYFCFITLTTIGFGDFVPAQKRSNDNWEGRVSIALCSLYLLFGIALLAMSFNLVQEEVISNVKTVARHLGIIKDDSDSEYVSD